MATPAPIDPTTEAEAEDRRIGALLVARGVLPAPQLERALRLQRESDERLGNLLVRLGFVAERDLAQVLAEQLGLALVATRDYPEAPVAGVRIPPEFLKRARAIPIDDTPAGVVVAMADPDDASTVHALRLALGRPVLPRVGVGSEIDAAIQRQHGEGGLDEIVPALVGEDEAEADDIERLRDLASEAPIVRLVNGLIARAIDGRASDIHIEPFESVLKIRYRVDGVLREMDAPPVRSTAAVISRIKVMANLNIAERRLPQDGRIKLRVEGREVDMRISTVPTMHGESVVMRILDKGSVPLDFTALGFDGESLTVLRAMLARPQGIVLVTGPTGSGKTTTLYAALHQLNTPDKKILTVEDPVEYQLEGVNQIQVKPQIGLTFANALRSILRQDPDVIMVGEMRDIETARIAVQAALTGHKVFSTLHTNDAASTVTRLLDMGVEDYLVTSTVNGVVAQRLVRVLCEHCRVAQTAPPDLVDELRLRRFVATGPVTLYRPGGCEHCDGVGYRGRTNIVELLPMSERVRQAVLARHDARAIARAAVEDGSRTMHDDGLAKACIGVTSVEEVERVTQEA
ncbi:MAG: type II secretion system ATPase GspE [Ectothiorhodospiraceae bacterium]|nr:type II secretion system ATPase GspE [Chromatiales bacterium]MCP5155330.1 type II secretion system ATPase GspE [Ectothiorhodospiraceae bacterium]